MWVNQGILSNKEFKEIEQRVSKIKAPQNVGRMPLKIGSGFLGYAADQWHNWIIIFSPMTFKNVIPANHLCCWLLFVQACHLICAYIITTPVIDQQLYGNKACTPNMHLHLQCICI